MELETIFICAIVSHNLVQRGDHVLIALSGGADSVALLLLFKSVEARYSLKLSAFHLNHQLRGVEADNDENFSKALCEGLGIPCYAYSENIEAYAELTSQSFELAAREKRYALLEMLKETYHVQKIALAHHLNDQVETFFLRLMRGSGLDGLTGMEWKRNDLYIRPLLSATRLDIESYLKRLDQKYCMDLTNGDVHYLRNRIRHELLPYLENHFNPQVVYQINQTMAHLADDKDYLERVANDWIDQRGNWEAETFKLSLDAFLCLHQAIAHRVLRSLFLRLNGNLQGFESSHVDEIMAIARGKRHQSMKVFQNIKFLVHYESLWIGKGKPQIMIEDYVYDLPSEGQIVVDEAKLRLTVSIMSKDEKIDLKNQNFIYINADHIFEPLRIRNYRPGDGILLKGLNGRKKVKSVFRERRMDEVERKTCPILVHGDTIVWVYEGLLSAPFYVNNETNRVLRLTIEKL